MSKKIKEVAEERLNNIHKGGKIKKSPEAFVQEAMVQGEFASRERNEFFDAVQGEILVDLFEQWRTSAVEQRELRDDIYYTALALNAVKDRMIEKEMFGHNVKNAGLYKEDK